MPTIPQTLVKYECPIMLADDHHSPAATTTGFKGASSSGAPNSPNKKAATTACGGGAAAAALAKKKNRPGATAGAVAPSEQDVLYSIVVPRLFEDGGKRWIQYPSSTPATRLDVITLQEQLDTQLELRQARETGLCPIREELYGQAFDELIRQVTIGCAERGLLLLRVRDEMKMTLAAYRSLYESSVAFGMRRTLQAEQEKSDMQQAVATLVREKEELEQQLAELTEQCSIIQEREEQRRQEEERKHADEVAYFKKTYQTLTASLQSVINPMKN